MSGKIRNPERRCKICGGKCNKRMRYCPSCARERKREAAGEMVEVENKGEGEACGD